ncbi:P-loop containing nucleoside triphosphate hydrolase protein [Hyaloraphidium curvatum]|nr:P-loop containing nucleoside triphosphate hydrolase protein [Hyaloraphidium curvatum]
MMGDSPDAEMSDADNRPPSPLRPGGAKLKGKEKEDAPEKRGATAENLPWVEKYRPTQMDEIISHADIISTIDRFIAENRLPHLLFYGPPGTGKTTTILAVARKLYGPRWRSMVLELNASDDRGIDVVREQIKSFASTRTMFSSGFKLIILDEADNMTQPAQAALRRVIERYTSNVRFCLVCNYASKIIPALQSRCTRFRFAPLGAEQVRSRLDHILEKEGTKITPEGLQAVLKLSQGDMRRALNVLQSCHAAYGTVGEREVYMCTGNPLPEDIQRIIEWMMGDEISLAYSRIQNLKVERGYALADILTEVHEFVHGLEMPPNCRVFVLDRMAEIEHRLNTGCTEKIQLGALIGAFSIATDLAAKAG